MRQSVILSVVMLIVVSTWGQQQFSASAFVEEEIASPHLKKVVGGLP